MLVKSVNFNDVQYKKHQIMIASKSNPAFGMPRTPTPSELQEAADILRRLAGKTREQMSPHEKRLFSKAQHLKAGDAGELVELDDFDVSRDLSDS